MISIYLLLDFFLFDLSFDFLLIWIVPWQDKRDFRRIFLWFCLHIKWFVWFGRLVFNLIYTRMFFRTLIERIKRILQVCGNCSIKDKILDGLNLSSRKRSRSQIRLESLCIEKTKVKKNPCQRLRVHRCDPWVFFDLRSVAAGSQDELLQGLSIFRF